MCMITESSELCDIICNQSIMWGTWMPGKRDIVRDEEVGKVLLKSQSILEPVLHSMGTDSVPWNPVPPSFIAAPGKPNKQWLFT